MKKVIFFILLVAGLSGIEPHGFVKRPLSRTSIFRERDTNGAQGPFWWNDTGVWCGNVQQDLNYSQCGRCGDAFGETHANQGGKYDKAIITGTYIAGEVIDIRVEITVNHRGFFTIELCPHPVETDNCFSRLNIVDGSHEIRSGNMMCTGPTQAIGPITARVQLPANVRCSRCTLRWTYRTAYPPAPDHCFNPNPAQTFRNCVDVDYRRLLHRDKKRYQLITLNQNQRHSVELIYLCLNKASLSCVEPHGFVQRPLSRTSIFRERDTNGAQVPFWWNDTGVWCGNVQQDLNYSQCGRCGDVFGETHANQGGRYDKAIITGTYNAGQVIDIRVEITANHRGFFTIELCPNPVETDNCFSRLNIVGGSHEIRSGNMMCVGPTQVIGPVTARVQLPANVRCTRCSLRWTYRTAYPPAPDHCFNPNPAQTFRNCVDVRIN
ncbi:hypothetical protein Bhyg_04902 [Pseudolycoriella hygida]|uniref:Chitin-binding type-4 domain-containing protein n=1 Tax=Pseudolycoriella hygida TaxID=35572 RepID=A0A9Q0NG77_9DIPT|nr:hypothetical protein Bhyg_04902 [Pseudolycoriella hygida]